MKNKIAQFLMMIVLTIGFAAFANAQSGPTHRVTVPFNFIVGDRSYAAGEYTVSFGISAITGTLLLRSADGKQSTIVNQTVPKKSDRKSKDGNFVFYVEDGHYYLAEINTARKSVELRGSHLRKMPKARKYELAMVR